MGANGNPGNDMDRLRALFESCSLSNYESRILAALVRLGWATANQLAEVTGIYRPNVYPVLESLTIRNLAERRPEVRGTWGCPDVEAIVGRLRAAETKRLEEAQAALSQRTSEIQAVAARLAGPDRIATSAVSLLEEARLAVLYTQAMPSVREEILVFNRGPYVYEVEADPLVLAALERGVKARAIYQCFELDGPDGADLRGAAEAYVAAGVESRVTDSLPVSLAILDRSLALLNVPGGQEDDVPFIANVVVENAGLAGLLADAFDRVWERSQVYGTLADSGHDDPGETATEATG